MAYNLTLNNQQLQMSLARTGGQGTKGDSVTSVTMNSDGDLIVVISNAAGDVVSTTNVGGSEYISSLETLYDNFDDRYLGTKTSAPTVDNDGDALLTGALYFNTTTNALGVYNGTAWEHPVSDAQTAQTAAETAQTAAELAETNASTSETNAAASATAAATSETNAGTSETNAAASEINAASSATSASSSATNAATSETNAASSASNAATSESNAAASASAASTSESNAATSATDAATSESNAATSASNASTSATNAASSANDASTSEGNASASASAAAVSEANAASSQSSAATSATNAATSATNAANSESNASATLAQVQTIYDNFDDRYLGNKSSDPTTDNDGDALVTGTFYYNTTTNELKVFSGSAWVAPSTSASNSASAAATSATSAATSATNAATSATNAATSETNASTSASAAATSASNASTSETNAATSETNASNSETNAATSASNASTSETNAANSATAAAASESAAATSESNASTSESNASTSETNAATSATNAAASATAAASSESAAATSETNAATSESNASTSATNAATSETNAGNSATAAASSASAAATSETNAATSASNAATSETNAATSETNAANSATSASTSASNAATSESNASTSESNAATSATNASNSASAASTSETNAAASATAAETAYDNFDDRYLGSKASDPTLDNDGDALVAGALYFNTGGGSLRVYDGTQWNPTAATTEAIEDIVDGLLTQGNGITLTYDDAGNTLTIDSEVIEETVTNNTASTITKGTPVYQSGTAGQTIEITPAAANSSSTMPAIGIVTEDITASGTGKLALIGRLQNVDTSAFTEGATLYIGASGGLTTTVPSGEGNLIQNIGKVTKSNASSGSIIVTGAGRANATPNLNDGNFFLGNASNQATTTSFNGAVDSHLNTSSATTGEYLSWNGSDYDWASVPPGYADSDVDTHLNTSGASSGQYLGWNGSDYAWSTIDLTTQVSRSGDSMTGFLTLHADPTNALHAATKEYVDTIAAAGIHYHTPVRVESPDSAGNLNATYNNGSSGVGATLTNAGTQAALVIDGVTLNTNDRVLIYSQTNSYENGIYTVTNTGSASTNWVLTRATDADSYGASDPDAFGEGDAFFVKEGNTGAGELYVMNTSGTITFGTTPITFTVIAETAVYSAGTGLTLDGTVFSIGQDVATSANVTFNNITVTGTVDGRDVATDGSKLDGIESGATADQTAAEIRTLVESATDSNVFTDADHTKLNGIESGATGDQTASEIKTAYESNSNTNAFTDALLTKLNGIEASADVTDTTNVTAAGAVMDSELTSEAAVKAINQQLTTTSSPTFAAVTVNGTATTDGVTADGLIKNVANSVTASGATTTIDMTASNFHVITMNASTTFSLSNLASAITSSGTLVIKQDATGGRSFTLPSSCKTPVGGASIVQYTGANSTSILSYIVVSSTEVLVNYVGNFA